MSTDDDEALNWDDGTDDASHVDHRASASGPAASTPAAPSATSSTSGSAALVLYGVLAGVYLLFTVGWIIAVGRDGYSVPNLLGAVMYQFGQFLSIAAPAVWFLATVLLTRERRAGVRVGALAVGALLLAPWPFILSGAVG